MKKIIILFVSAIITLNSFSQTTEQQTRTKVMTLGVFHFAYPNLDAVKTKKEDQISVLEEPYQSEIIAIAHAILEFKPTIIAIETDPAKQGFIDSLYHLYKQNKFELKKNETYQLGFRIGKQMNAPIYCVNDWGHYYKSIEEIFEDSVRLAKFEHYYFHSEEAKKESKNAEKVSSIIDQLIKLNNPERVKNRLAVYLDHPFKYEEQAYDFIGVDFETSRWFNRNLRIFRNVQRIPHDENDRILVIMGADHLNLLNPFFDVSTEFELISPLPYLENIPKN